MNCEKLHNALALKDQEIKERKENTIRCFEIVKDWALEKVISEVIDNEFKYHISLREGDIYKKMFKETGIDVSELYFDYSWPCFDGKRKPQYKTNMGRFGMHFLDIPEKDRERFMENGKKELAIIAKVAEFNEKFDHVLFWNLIDSHILKNGFSTYKMKNIWGQMVTMNYYYVTTRSKLEKACCPDGKKGSPQYRVDGEPNMTAQDIFAIAVIVIIFVVAALFIFGGLK